MPCRVLFTVVAGAILCRLHYVDRVHKFERFVDTHSFFFVSRLHLKQYGISSYRTLCTRALTKVWILLHRERGHNEPECITKITNKPYTRIALRMSMLLFWCVRVLCVWCARVVASFQMNFVGLLAFFRGMSKQRKANLTHVQHEKKGASLDEIQKKKKMRNETYRIQCK